MHGLIRRSAMAVGVTVLALGSAAGAAITTGTAAQAAAVAGTAAAAGSDTPIGPTTTYAQPARPDGANCTNDTYTVGADVTRLQVVVIGAGGGSGTNSTADGGGGGRGERVQADLNVTPGEALNVNVADNGYAGEGSGPFGGTTGTGTYGGTGGDPSYISTADSSVEMCSNGSFLTIAPFLVLAGGGGGGGGGSAFGGGGGGGDAGFTSGGNGGAGDHNGPAAGAGGGGGTQTAGGSGGNPATTVSGTEGGDPGSFLNGGCAGKCDSNNTDGNGAGGGGGGYYGGGAGGDGQGRGGGGGGGGSSFVTAGALNVSGSPVSDPPSVSITPIVGAPSAPTDVGAVTNAQLQATVYFTPSAIDGGSPIESYTVYAKATDPGFDQMGFGSGSPITVSNLTAGQTYTFTVTATNAAGEGAASAPSNSVIVYKVPQAPVITSATAGNGSVTVTFKPSATDTRLQNLIFSYTVTASPPTGPAISKTENVNSSPFDPDPAPVTVTGLTNGLKYKVTVSASNYLTGPASAPQVLFPAAVPGAPTNVTAVNVTGANRAVGTVNVSFTPPASDGGQGIQGYTAVSHPGGIIGTAAPNASYVQVTGLTYGTSYTFTVYASNLTGKGPASAPSNAVTPEPIPSPPQVPFATPLDQAASVSCVPPASNGGSPIVSYTVTSSPGGITATGASCPVVVTGLTDGTSYTFTVTATNAAGGTSQPSPPTNPVIPRVDPPLNPGAAPLDQAAYVSCQPPANEADSSIASYTVTSSPGGITATGASCPILVTGLTDGTSYTFTVTATNAAGDTSQPSRPTAPVTPRPNPSGPPPANDNFASAQVITGTSGSVSGTNIGATVEPNEPTIQDNRGGASVWYEWVVPATGTYQFDTCTATPAVIGIIGAFTGNSVGNLTELQDGPSEFSCPNNADGSGEAGATITISPIAGQTIYIKFDGLNPDSNANPPYEGPFTLEWKQIS
jgi:fibronectin type III domain protein